jgi:hypothetical protein
MHGSTGWDQRKHTNIFELLSTGDEPYGDQEDEAATLNESTNDCAYQASSHSSHEVAESAVPIDEESNREHHEDVSRRDPRFHPVKTSNNWRADAAASAMHSRFPNSATTPLEEYHRLRERYDGPQHHYNVASGPRTRNGVYWASIRRGTIVKVRDVRRCYDTKKKVGDAGIVLGPDLQLWKDEARFFLVKDRYWSHLDARAVYTHDGYGLKNKAPGLKQQAMCFKPYRTRPVDE